MVEHIQNNSSTLAGGQGYGKRRIQKERSLARHKKSQFCGRENFQPAIKWSKFTVETLEQGVKCPSYLFVFNWQEMA